MQTRSAQAATTIAMPALAFVKISPSAVAPAPATESATPGRSAPLFQTAVAASQNVSERVNVQRAHTAIAKADVSRRARALSERLARKTDTARLAVRVEIGCVPPFAMPQTSVQMACSVRTISGETPPFRRARPLPAAASTTSAAPGVSGSFFATTNAGAPVRRAVIVPARRAGRRTLFQRALDSAGRSTDATRTSFDRDAIV